MNFFKKLFSSNKEEKKQEEGPFKGVYTETYFNNRYTEEDGTRKSTVADGSIRMVDSYFLEYKLEKKVSSPVNHPANLDQVISDGIGFQQFCKLYNFDDAPCAMFLAYSFSEFMITNFGFKLYSDKEPEFPLRPLTLKYNKNGTILSLYPLEYSVKVLNREASFEDMFNRLKNQLEALPGANELLKKMSKEN